MSFTVRYMEDLLLFSDWFKELLKLHFFKDGLWNMNKHPVEIKSHVRTLDNVEVDLMISNGEIVVIVELKKYDVETAIKQAMTRRHFADYIYIALDLPTHTIVRMLKKHQEALKAGIGIISAKDNCIVIRAYPQSKHKKKVTENRIDTELNILDLFED